MNPQLPEPNPYVQYPQPHAPRSKRWLWIVLVILLVAGTGVGVYFWQQGQVDSARREKDQAVQQAQQQEEPAQESAQTADFTGPKLPFTFKRPSDWVLQSDTTLTYDNPMSDSYGLSLYAPGTVETGAPIGGTEIAAGGASIILSVSKSSIAVASEDLVKNFPGTKPTVTKTTVAGQPAIEYEYAYESPKRVYTVVIKDGMSYTIMFEAKNGEDLKANAYYKHYQDLVKSFTLK